jgi:hypothetical protein
MPATAKPPILCKITIPTEKKGLDICSIALYIAHLLKRESSRE